MTFSCLLRDSYGLSFVFAALVIIAVFTQLTKATISKSLPVYLRAVLKAAPALFLAGLSYYVGLPFIALAFLFCAIGDILLDLPEDKAPLAFELGAASFALALIVFSISYLQKPLEGYPLLPLSFTNVVIAIFVLRWVFPKLKGVPGMLEGCYLVILIVSNVIASTSHVPIFLGSSLWLMSDLSIGIESKDSDSPANSLDTLGLYDLGLYFLAIGFLNTLVS